MGLHTVAAEIQNGEYATSLTLVRAQRVAAAGHGDQTLLSSANAQCVNGQLPPLTTLRDLRPHKLRGLTEYIYQLVAADLPAEFPPLRVEPGAASPVAPLHQLVRGRLVGREWSCDNSSSTGNVRNRLMDIWCFCPDNPESARRALRRI